MRRLDMDTIDAAKADWPKRRIRRGSFKKVNDGRLAHLSMNSRLISARHRFQHRNASEDVPDCLPLPNSPGHLS
jgi:hypothetical protein